MSLIEGYNCLVILDVVKGGEGIPGSVKLLAGAEANFSFELFSVNYKGRLCALFTITVFLTFELKTYCEG